MPACAMEMEAWRTSSTGLIELKTRAHKEDLEFASTADPASPLGGRSFDTDVSSDSPSKDLPLADAESPEKKRPAGDSSPDDVARQTTDVFLLEGPLLRKYEDCDDTDDEVLLASAAGANVHPWGVVPSRIG